MITLEYDNETSISEFCISKNLLNLFFNKERMFLKVNPFTYILPYELGEIYPLESTSRVSENSLKPQIEILISSPGPNL